MKKIITVGLILLMSLAGCSGDKVSRQPTAYLESNTPSDPLQTSETKSFYIPPTRAPLQTSETKSLHLTKTRAPLEICNHDLNIDIPEYEDPEVARVDSIEDVLRYSHISHRMREEIRRIFGKDSLFTEDEKMSHLLSHDYRWSQLVCILVQMEEDDNISTPLYQHLRQRVYQQDPFIDMI
jgi:hypothetical protein